MRVNQRLNDLGVSWGGVRNNLLEDDGLDAENSAEYTLKNGLDALARMTWSHTAGGEHKRKYDS